jgi:hypothetical protein
MIVKIERFHPAADADIDNVHGLRGLSRPLTLEEHLKRTAELVLKRGAQVLPVRF